jgi:hypothetical protein
MATVTLRSDQFPVGTTVGIYPAEAQRFGQAPSAAVIASAAVDAAGLLTVTNGSILSYTSYVAYASVGGEHRYARLRSTLDLADTGAGTGTGTTTSGSPIVSPWAVSTGAFAVGQRISTLAASAAIPAGTTIAALSSLASGGVTADAPTDVFTRAAHGLRVGDPVVFSALTGGAGITAGALYYVSQVLSSSTFKVSSSRGGTALDVTSNLTAGTVVGVMVLSANAGASGAQNLVAEGARVAVAELGADPVARGGTWQARLAQRRLMAGTS